MTYKVIVNYWNSVHLILCMFQKFPLFEKLEFLHRQVLLKSTFLLENLKIVILLTSNLIPPSYQTRAAIKKVFVDLKSNLALFYNKGHNF